jgi:hypothetical protein
MKILAIDPGSKESAWVIFEGSVENILSFGFETNEICLNQIQIRCGTPDMLAIESIEGFGMTAGQELFDTCFWSGRFCQAFTGEFQRLGRKAIKIHLCGNSTAKDKDIREALIYRYGDPGTKRNPGKLYGISGHCWSALAVAVTCADLNKSKNV